MGINSFTGTGVALVTPFYDDYTVDEASLRELVEYVIGQGVDFLVPLGTTSEAPTLSAEEKNRVMNIILDQNKKRLPVMVGLGGNNTEEVIKNINSFPALSGCDAVLSVIPYYNKPTQEGLYLHFKDISEKSPLPVFLYNVPGRTGVNMNASTVIRLAKDCPTIVGIKEASANFEQVSIILKDVRPDFVTLSGDDGVTLPLMSMGVQGVISVLANAFPAEFSRMVKLANKGDFRTAAQIHLGFVELYGALFAEGNPAGIKAVLHAKGIIKHNRLRLPLTEVSEGLYRKIKELC